MGFGEVDIQFVEISGYRIGIRVGSFGAGKLQIDEKKVNINLEVVNWGLGWDGFWDLG
jgi:hypothetical protein